MFLLPKSIDSNAVETITKPNENKQKDDNLPWVERIKLILSLVGLYIGIANTISRSVNPIIYKTKLGFDESMMGTVMSINFGFGGFSNAFLLAPVTKFLGGNVTLVVKNCIICASVQSVLYLLQAVLYS